MDKNENDGLWINCHIATCATQDLGMINRGAIAVKNGNITWVGAMDDLPANIIDGAKIIHDVGMNVVTPGLIDCHTHLIYGGNRANEFAMRLAGQSYQEISESGGGIMSTVNQTRAASEESLLHEAGKRLSHLICEGVTSIEIKSGYGLDVDTEIKILRLAKMLEEKYPVSVYATYLGAHAIPPEYDDRRGDYIDLICQQMIPYVAKENLATAVDAYLEEVAYNAEEVERIFKAASEHGLAVKLHADQLTDGGGAALAAKYQALSADHIEFSDEKAIIDMAKAGTVATLLPGAFYFLREKQKPNIHAMRKHGVPMAIATDSNPGTSPTCSLQLMMNMACITFGLTSEEAICGATINAARALGAQDHIGSIEIGKQADFVIWDVKCPKEILYRFGENRVHSVIKSGCVSIANP